MKVLITPRGFFNYGMDIIEDMRSKGLEVHYNDTGNAYTHEEFLRYAEDADGIIVGVDTIDKALIDACPNLKVICKFGVGTDNIDTGYAAEKAIFVGRTLGSNTNAVAEHVMALMYSEAKNVYPTVKEVKEFKWQKPTGREISGKTLGIIGFGAIGQQLARHARGIGMSVLAYDAFEIDQEISEETGAEISTFENILKRSDYLSLHVPLTKTTKDLISKDELKKMKPATCLINTSRGGIVNETDLLDALKNGEIRSSCFDVYSEEPPRKEDELVKQENFMLTPHTAARTIESERRTCELSASVILKRLLV